MENDARVNFCQRCKVWFESKYLRVLFSQTYFCVRHQEKHTEKSSVMLCKECVEEFELLSHDARTEFLKNVENG